MNNPIKTGDSVKLKGVAGPTMTVSRLNYDRPNEVWCSWFYLSKTNKYKVRELLCSKEALSKVGEDE